MEFKVDSSEVATHGTPFVVLFLSSEPICHLVGGVGKTVIEQAGFALVAHCQEAEDHGNSVLASMDAIYNQFFLGNPAYVNLMNTATIYAGYGKSRAIFKN